MDFDATIRLPARVDEVAAMLADPVYVDGKAAAMGALEHEADVSTLPDGTLTVRLRRVMPAVVPEFVRRFVGETITVVETDHWYPEQPDGTRRGELTVQIERAPVSVHGTMRLVPDDDGTGSVQSAHATIRAKVPLVGRQIEEAIVQVLDMAARKEEEVAIAWLTSRR